MKTAFHSANLQQKIDRWTTCDSASHPWWQLAAIARTDAKATHAGERCEFNFGARPFAYPVAGYRAVQRPPGDAKAASWLLSAFKRLITSAISCGWGLSRDTAWVCLPPLPLVYSLWAMLICLPGVPLPNTLTRDMSDGSCCSGRS